MTNAMCPWRDKCLNEPGAVRARRLVCDRCPFRKARERLEFSGRFSAFAYDFDLAGDPAGEEPGFEVEGPVFRQ